MKPNLVCFLLDALRPDQLASCGGDALGDTFIDEVIRRGTVFTHTFAAGPYTLIALNALATSFYGSANGVSGYFQNTPEDLNDDIITFVDLLKRSGYSTLYFSEYGSRPCMPPYSFDVFSTGVTCDESLCEQVAQYQSPRFVMFHLEHVHDTCSLSHKATTPEQYRRVVGTLAEQFERLYRRFVSEDDLVVVFSDHGIRIREPFDQLLTPRRRNYREHTTGTFVTDKTTRTFFSLSGPQIEAGLRIDKLVRSIDIAPTLLEWLDVGGLGAQGTSLKPFMTSDTQSDLPDLTAYMETGGMRTSPWRPEVRAIRTNQWKFVDHDRWGQGLYRMTGRPDDEACNLIGQGVAAEDELQVALRQQQTENCRPVTSYYEAGGIDYASVIADRPATLAVPNPFKAKIAAEQERKRIMPRLLRNLFYRPMRQVGLLRAGD